MGGASERELKGILQADDVVLEKVTRSFPEDIKKSYYKIKLRPFIVIRAAGSFGVDIVAIRGDISLPIEEKSISSKKYHFSSNQRVVEQLEKFRCICMDAGLFPLYAFRLKRVRKEDPWRVFTLPMPKSKFTGIPAYLYKKIPKLRETESKYYVMDWDEGLPMYKLIDRLCGV